MLQNHRVYNEAFRERGNADVVKIDTFPLDDVREIELEFESSSSKWRQGVWLKTDEGLWINDIFCPSAFLWQDTCPKIVPIRCVSTDGILFVYNIWERDGIRSSLSYSSGMLITELANGRRYSCNDIGFDTEFKKLVFTVIRKHE